MESNINKWKRYRFKSYNESPLIFNPKYPFWISGYGENVSGEYCVIIAYLPISENLQNFWSDAFDVEFQEKESIVFSDRFPKPNYYGK